MTFVSPEIALMVSPRKTYAALVQRRQAASVLTALRRPLLVAIVIGVSVSIASTGRATPALVVSATVTWSYIVVLQLAIAMAMIARPARRTVGLARALDLFFAGHAPWSLYLLAVANWPSMPGGPPWWLLQLSIAIPVMLTIRIVAAFGAEVLGLSRVTPGR